MDKELTESELIRLLSADLILQEDLDWLIDELDRLSTLEPVLD
jgi:hypothetical protein